MSNQLRLLCKRCSHIVRCSHQAMSQPLNLCMQYPAPPNIISRQVSNDNSSSNAVQGQLCATLYSELLLFTPTSSILAGLEGVLCMCLILTHVMSLNVVDSSYPDLKYTT